MINSKKKIIIFGTSLVSETAIKCDFFDVTYIVDNNKEKWGNLFLNKKIYSPEKIYEENFSEIIILLAFSPTGTANSFVSKQLKEMGLVEHEHFLNIFEVLPNDYPYQKIISSASYAPWKIDEQFKLVYNIVKDHTLVDINRCYELWTLVDQVSKLEGAFIEIGVWKGGTGALIAKRAELCGVEDKIYLCDTFNGVVKANPEHDNAYKGGEHNDTTLDLVEYLLYDQLELKNVKILSGIFPNETHSLIEENSFRFCHIDVDVYDSAKDIFLWIWDKMVVGGIVVFDDYGFITCQGITKLVDELRKKSDALFLYNINGHGILIKIK